MEDWIPFQLQVMASSIWFLLALTGYYLASSPLIHGLRLEHLHRTKPLGVPHHVYYSRQDRLVCLLPRKRSLPWMYVVFKEDRLYLLTLIKLLPLSFEHSERMCLLATWGLLLCRYVSLILNRITPEMS